MPKERLFSTDGPLPADPYDLRAFLGAWVARDLRERLDLGSPAPEPSPPVTPLEQPSRVSASRAVVARAARERWSLLGQRWPRGSRCPGCASTRYSGGETERTS